MKTFIAIYNDGNYISKPNIEDAFLLPGNYFVFQIGSSHHINKPDGISYFKNQNETAVFKLNHLELIDIYNANNNFSKPLYFSVYDHQTDRIIKINGPSNHVPYSLCHVIQKIITASKFPSWETYDAVLKIDEFKAEINQLKIYIEELKKQNKELK